MSKIPILEIFGSTIQGEGMVIGQKTMFVRTAGCDYSCSWCDSKYTWDGSEKHNIRMLNADVIMSELERIGGDNFNHVTISGGNPALIGKGMDELIDIIHEKGHRVGLETQGSKWQDWFLKIDDLTISPKPPSSLMKTNFEILDSIIEHLAAGKVNFSLKVVVFDDKDFDYAKEIHKRYSDIPMYTSVGNPNPYDEGDIVGDLLKRLEWLFDKAIQDPEMNSVRVLPQLHTLVWGNKREV
jgi:7-carboxy-7-deazaguanine synthase